MAWVSAIRGSPSKVWSFERVALPRWIWKALLNISKSKHVLWTQELSVCIRSCGSKAEFAKRQYSYAAEVKSLVNSWCDAGLSKYTKDKRRWKLTEQENYTSISLRSGEKTVQTGTHSALDKESGHIALTKTVSTALLATSTAPETNPTVEYEVQSPEQHTRLTGQAIRPDPLPDTKLKAP